MANTIVWDGDSLTAETVPGIGNGYPSKVQPLLVGPPYVTNVAISGASAGACPHAGFVQKRGLYVLLAGVNDYNAGSTGPQVYGFCAAAILAARNAGLRTIVSTVFNSSLMVGQKNVERLAGNALIRADRAGADGLIDFAADAWFEDPSHFPDGTHPDAAGCARQALLAFAEINRLFAIMGQGMRQAILLQENQVLSNRALSGADWTATNVTRASGQADPAGGVQATLMSETAVNAAHFVTATGATMPLREQHWCAFSVCLKAGTRNFAGILADCGAFAVTALWNLTTGANTALLVTGATANVAQQFAKAEDLGNGWWRFTMAFYMLGSAVVVFPIAVIMSSDGAVTSYLGDITKNVLAFAPGTARANWAGPITDTTGAVIAGPLRNLAANPA